LAFAGALPLVQSGEDSDGGMEAASRVADARRYADWRPVLMACRRHRSAHGLSHELEAFVVGLRAVLSEALDGGVYQTRVDFADYVPAETEAIQHTF
jgi:hypothetical protein